MDPERWARIEEVFQAALTRNPETRIRYVEEACGDDGEVVREVKSLLKSHDQSSDFLDGPALGNDFVLPPASGQERDGASSMIGKRIGSYRLVEVIAHGGMGTVFRAVRADDQFEHQVAIKIIRRGMDTDEIIHRFRSERQTLARLDHPNIARLLDGGTTEDGLPFLVMECIEGRPIHTYCRESQISTTARLRLFRTICSAVHYAHQNLVIHRDIKPSNILVTDDGIPKLLDFGVAKILSPDPGNDDPTTVGTSSRFMTPEYASPEQFRCEAITTATDVYALGVVLYELLSGQHPYRFGTRSPQEMERTVCEIEPARPSTAVLSGETDEPLDGDKLRRRLTGDLDTIILMALRKEPARRYASVQQFSDDIQRHLEGLPVTARKDTLRYRSVKFVRRHKTGVIAAFVVIAAVISGVVLIAMSEREARLKADNANRAMAGLLGLVRSFDPTAGAGSRTTVQQILDHGAESVADELRDHPEARIEFMEAVAGVYEDLALWERSLTWRKQVHDTRVDLKDDPRALADSLLKLGEALCHVRRFEDAQSCLNEALAIRKNVFGDEHAEVAAVLHQMAVTRYSESGLHRVGEPLYRQALAMRRRVLPPNHPDLIETLSLLAALLQNKGDYDEAETMMRESLRIARSMNPQDTALLSRAVGDLGALLHDRARFAEAEPMRREVLDISTVAYGQDHPTVGVAMEQLGLLLKDMERYDEAAPLLERAIEIKSAQFGEDSRYVAYSYHCLAKLHTDAGVLGPAEAACRKALKFHISNFPPGHRDIARPMSHLGRILVMQGRYAEAEPLLRDALAIRLKRKPPGHWKTGKTKSVLGACLAGLGRFEEAEPLVLEGYPLIAADRGPRHRRTREAIQRIVDVYDLWRRPTEAAHWREKLVEATPATQPAAS